MAELTIDPATIRKALDDFVESYKPSDTPTQEVGYVATAGDGIAHVTGLPGCMANELLTFEDGTLGLAFNLDAREIGVVILGDFAGIEEGQEVRRTGEVLSVAGGQPPAGRGGEMSKSNCEPALLSSLETLQHNLQDAGMLRMKASLYSEAAVREALGDSEYRRISEKLDRRALLAQLDAVSLFLLQVLGLVSVGEGDGDLLSAEADVMNGAGEFPHLFAFCMIPEPSGATGSDTEIVERFVKRLSLCLH